MKATYALITSENLTLEKVADTLKHLGCVYEKSGNVNQCRITKDNDHLWIFKDDSMIPVYEDMGHISEIQKKLGNLKIGSVIILESTSNIKGKQLVHEVICSMSKIVPVVWEFEDSVFLSHKDIIKRCDRL